MIDFPAFFNHNHFLRFSSINSTSSQSFASNSLVPALFVIHDSGPIIFPTVEISTPVLPLEGSVMEEFPSIFLVFFLLLFLFLDSFCSSFWISYDFFKRSLRFDFLFLFLDVLLSPTSWTSFCSKLSWTCWSSGRYDPRSELRIG